jgi:hypothetical protein
LRVIGDCVSHEAAILFLLRLQRGHPARPDSQRFHLWLLALRRIAAMTNFETPAEEKLQTAAGRSFA